MQDKTDKEIAELWQTAGEDLWKMFDSITPPHNRWLTLPGSTEPKND